MQLPDLFCVKRDDPFVGGLVILFEDHFRKHHKQRRRKKKERRKNCWRETFVVGPKTVIIIIFNREKDYWRVDKN